MTFLERSNGPHLSLQGTTMPLVRMRTTSQGEVTLRGDRGVGFQSRAGAGVQPGQHQ